MLKIEFLLIGNMVGVCTIFPELIWIPIHRADVGWSAKETRVVYFNSIFQSLNIACRKIISNLFKGIKKVDNEKRYKLNSLWKKFEKFELIRFILGFIEEFPKHVIPKMLLINFVPNKLSK